MMKNFMNPDIYAFRLLEEPTNREIFGQVLRSRKVQLKDLTQFTLPLETNTNSLKFS
jgi:hypothetical protein